MAGSSPPDGAGSKHVPQRPVTEDLELISDESSDVPTVEHPASCGLGLQAYIGGGNRTFAGWMAVAVDLFRQLRHPHCSRLSSFPS